MAYPRPAMPSVTIRDAATMLGVSPDTIRRRLARGELTGQQVHSGGRAGFTWYVDLPDADAAPEPGALAVPAVVPAASDLQRQLDDLRAERDRLLAIIETLAARPPAVPQIAQAADPKRGRVGRAIDALRGR
jgi:hypothetical protein